MVKLLKNVSMTYYIMNSAHLNDIEPELEYYDDDNDNEQIMDDNHEGQADHGY